jgi:hypothetical protein
MRHAWGRSAYPRWSMPVKRKWFGGCILRTTKGPYSIRLPYQEGGSGPERGPRGRGAALPRGGRVSRPIRNVGPEPALSPSKGAAANLFTRRTPWILPAWVEHLSASACRIRDADRCGDAQQAPDRPTSGDGTSGGGGGQGRYTIRERSGSVPGGPPGRQQHRGHAGSAQGRSS